ncbi:MAG: hypothetical protein HQK85_11100, partial [Nitrospinae bacterium]|nr:hypothetical protein [Nitrospinota bacterium]
LQTRNTLTGAVVSTFGYDTSGKLITVTDGDGNVTSIQRDGAGNATGIVSPYGVKTALTLNTNGYLASVTDPAGNATRFTYSPDGLMASMTDPNNGVYSFTHDAMGKLTSDHNPIGGGWTLTSSKTKTTQTSSITSAEGRTDTTLREILATGGERMTQTSPSGTVSEMLTKLDGTSISTNADGTVRTLALSPDPRFGMNAPITKSSSIKIPGGLTATMSTTRTVNLSNPSDPLTVTSLTEAVNINGKVTNTSFNKTNMTLTTTTPMSKQVIRKIDQQGRLTQASLFGLLPIDFTYDIKGRMNAVTQGTRLSSFAYDAMGNLAGVTDPLGQMTGFGYDTSGQVTSQTLPDGRVIYFTYDANGNVTSVTPPSRPAHGFNYTPVNLESSYNPPVVAGSGTTNTAYAYNLDKQLTRITRPDGQTIDYGYDTAGRLSAITLPSASVNYTYPIGGGCCGNPTLPQTIARSSGGATQTLNYTYDGSLLTSTAWSGEVNGTVSRTYDNNFRITSRSVNGANTISQAYDNDGNIASVGAMNITRNTGNGFITGTTLGSATTAYTYNTYGEADSYTAKYGATALFNTVYTRDVLGRITRKVETVQGVATTFDYAYDTAGRLSSVSKNGAQISSYVYDNNGNRITATQNGTATQGYYDLQDRLVTYGNNSYTYTSNGELLTKTNPGGSTAYNYDVMGNLISVTMPDGTLIEYVMDGQNRRIGKKVNGTLVQGWLYKDQLEPVAELDGIGNVVATFIYGTKAHSPDYMVKNGVSYRVINDHLGSPRLVVDTSIGAIAQRMDYDEWGNITADSSPGFTPFGFAGGLFDQHTKLVRFGARDYDSEVGRWTSKDPIGFDGGDVNLYGYVVNNPVNLSDSLGLYYIDINVTAGSGFGVTGGVLIGPSGIGGYVGVGVVTPGVGVSVTYSSSDISPGVTVAAQMQFGPAYQAGYGFGDGGGGYQEYGAGWQPGASGTLYYVFPPIPHHRPIKPHHLPANGGQQKCP